MPEQLVAGWTEVDDFVHDVAARQFEATYRIGRRKPETVKQASLDASDEACRAAIAKTVARIEAQGGKIIGGAS